MPGMNACQTNPSTSGSVSRVSTSSASNRHSSTFSAASLNTAKLVPKPSKVAPSGYALPGQISSAADCGVAAWVNEHTPKLTGRTRRYGGAQWGSITTKVADPNRGEVDRLLNPPDLPSYRTLRLEADDGVATITLNRPDRRNAVGDGMREELADAYLWCDGADAVRVVVLTGAPPAFCAGADLAAGERTFTEPGPTFSAAGVDVQAWTVSKPVIAAVNGHAIGLGLTLALQCDIRFFAADARYGVVQVRRGMVGDAYSHWVLPRLVGLSNAAEILLGGGTFDGHRAVQLGLGSRVLDADDVLPAAKELAHDIAENAAPAAVAASKRLLWDSFDLDRAAVGKRESEIHLALMRHDDAREGVRAFIERRPPRWTGR